MSKNKDLSSSKKPNDKEQHNKPATLLPGQPGYRTRDGRTGYDPIDTRTEAAHTAGSFIQPLFTGRIRNPIYLVLLGIFGLALVTPLVFAISSIPNGNQYSVNAWVTLLVMAVVGFAILINFIKNLIKAVFR